jgi:hypothetical protein
LVALGCTKEPASSSTDDSAAVDRRAPFRDVTSESGLDFVHFNGMTGEFYMAEVTGAVTALFDYDNDGDLDVYLVQGQLLGPNETIDETLKDRLYRNDLAAGADGEPQPRFVDVTEGAGIDARGYGMGVIAGDYDNDGFVDLYVTNLNANELWHNNGDGTFTDVTLEAAVEEERWSVSAAFVDYDRDGWLDLFIGNYIAASFQNRQSCRDFTGARDYCGPGSFDAEPDRLLRNRGGEGGPVRFTDVTQKAGLRTGFGGALGIVTGDFNGDRLVDLYVANDGLPNNLWVQKTDGTFADEALLAGCSVNGRGKAEASMGVSAADFDDDGDLDLFVAHLTGESNTLYVNNGNGVFDDRTAALGLAAPSRSFTSFGAGWLDYDSDGLLDLLVVSGAVKRIEALARAKDPFPLHQSNQLFRNTGGSRFDEIDAGDGFSLSEVSRGAAFGDVDNDGDIDVLIANNNGPARLLLNQSASGRHWVGVRALDEDGRRDLLGAVVELRTAGKPALRRQIRTEGSFASSNDPRAIFGLGDRSFAVDLRIYWPDGRIETWSGLEADRYHTLRQGSGRQVTEKPT